MKLVCLMACWRATTMSAISTMTIRTSGNTLANIVTTIIHGMAGSYQNNRGHYDLITVGGIDFIMLYMGWEIGDEEIQWMNDVLAQYPERKAILNFHEYLLASGGMGEQPQRIYDEVVATNPNVCNGACLVIIITHRPASMSLTMTGTASMTARYIRCCLITKDWRKAAWAISV